MFKAEVKNALADYTYDTMRQSEGVVTLTFYGLVTDKDKGDIEKALQSLINEDSIRDIKGRWEVNKIFTYLTLWEGKVVSNPEVKIMKG